jgi:DNA-binding MarR family transcriptional regulator
MTRVKTSDLSDSAVAAWARLLRTSQSLLADVEAGLKAAGLPPLVWYDALLELRGEKDGLRPYQLQERMLLTQYNMSRLLDRLAEAGYVDRRPCLEDGRGQIVHLTSAGRALLKRMWPVYRTLIAEHFSGRLSDKDCRDLARILDKLAPSYATG